MSRNINNLTKGEKANGSSPLNFEFYEDEGISHGGEMTPQLKTRIGRMMGNAVLRMPL